MSRAAAEALEPFRHYLLVLAKLHLDARLRGKLTRPTWCSRRCYGPTRR